MRQRPGTSPGESHTERTSAQPRRQRPHADDVELVDTTSSSTRDPGADPVTVRGTTKHELAALGRPRQSRVPFSHQDDAVGMTLTEVAPVLVVVAGDEDDPISLALGPLEPFCSDLTRADHPKVPSQCSDQQVGHVLRSRSGYGEDRDHARCCVAARRGRELRHLFGQRAGDAYVGLGTISEHC